MYQKIKYFKNNEDCKNKIYSVMHLINGVMRTEEELDKIRKKKFDLGYSHRMSGYYDKWYRYNTFDDGASYDEGVRAAGENPKCPNECQIVPCVYAN